MGKLTPHATSLAYASATALTSASSDARDPDASCTSFASIKLSNTRSERPEDRLPHKKREQPLPSLLFAVAMT